MLALCMVAAVLWFTGCQRQSQGSRLGSKPETEAKTAQDTGAEPTQGSAHALAEIQRLGGNFATDEQDPGKPPMIVDLSFKEATDVALAHLKGLTQLQKLYLIETRVTDAGLVYVKGFTNLETLDLGRTQVSDAGLLQIVGLTNLRTLGLSGTKVTDRGLASLKALTNLQYLDLTETKVTHAAVREFQKALPKVEVYR